MATFAIDPAHTDVLFSAKHMMVTTVRGTFTDVSGTVEINETDPTASHAEIVVQAASVDTGFGARDAHLRSDDFFGVETYPEIRVMSTGRPAEGRQGLRGDRRRDHPRRHPLGRLRRRVPRLLHRDGRDAARGLQCQGQGQPQGLGSRLERRARGRRLAGRRDRDSSRWRSPSRSWRPSPRQPDLVGSAAAPEPVRGSRRGYPWVDDHRTHLRRPEHVRAAARRPRQAARTRHSGPPSTTRRTGSCIRSTSTSRGASTRRSSSSSRRLVRASTSSRPSSRRRISSTRSIRSS